MEIRGAGHAASVPRTVTLVAAPLRTLVLTGHTMSPLPPEPWLNAHKSGNEGRVILSLLFCVLLFQVVTKQILSYAEKHFFVSCMQLFSFEFMESTSEQLYYSLSCSLQMICDRSSMSVNFILA